MGREAEAAEMLAAIDRSAVAFAEAVAEGDWGHADTMLGIVFGLAWLVDGFADHA